MSRAAVLWALARAVERFDPGQLRGPDGRWVDSLAAIIDDVSFESLDPDNPVYVGIREDGVLDLGFGNEDGPTTRFSRHDVETISDAAYELWRERTNTGEETDGVIDDRYVQTAGGEIYLAISEKRTYTADLDDPDDEDVFEPVLTVGIPTENNTDEVPDFHEVDLDEAGFDELIGNLERFRDDYTPTVVDDDSAGDNYDVSLASDHTIQFLDGTDYPPTITVDEAEQLAKVVERLLKIDVPAIGEDDEEPDTLDGEGITDGLGVSLLTDGSLSVHFGDGNYLEFERGDAETLAAGLRALVDKDRDRPGSGGIPAVATGAVERFDPNQLRDDEGQWVRVPGAGLVDKLKLAGRIELMDGEELLASDVFRTSDSGSMPLALTRGADGKRRLRLGLGIEQSDEKSWRGRNFGSTVVLDEAGAEKLGAALDEMAREGESGRARWVDLEKRDDALRSNQRDLIRKQYPNLTSDEARELDAIDELLPTLDSMINRLQEQQRDAVDDLPPDARAERDRLDTEIADLSAQRAALSAEVQDVDRLEAERDKLRFMGRKWTDEEDARWDSLTEQIEAFADVLDRRDRLDQDLRHLRDQQIQLHEHRESPVRGRVGFVGFYKRREQELAGLRRRREFALARRGELTANPVPLADADQRALDRVNSDLDQLNNEWDDLVEATLVDGVIPGPWGDLAYRTEMGDSEDPQYKLDIRPPDAPDDWYPGYDTYAIYLDDAAEVRNFAARLRALAATNQSVAGATEADTTVGDNRLKHYWTRGKGLSRAVRLWALARTTEGHAPRRADTANWRTDALIVALDVLSTRGPAREAAWDPAKHPRIPKGQPGAGRFMSLVERVRAKLQAHLDGGDGDPFEGFSREQLRRAAKARGVTVPRGASRDAISKLLLHIDEPAGSIRSDGLDDLSDSDVEDGELIIDRANLQRVEDARTIADLRAVARDRGLRIPSYLKRSREVRLWLHTELRLRPGEDVDSYLARTGGRPSASGPQRADDPRPIRRTSLRGGETVAWEPESGESVRGTVVSDPSPARSTTTPTDRLASR